MHVYAFILGRKYLLSVAELCAVIGQNGKIIDITSEALVAVFDVPLPPTCLKQLGGTVKIAEVVSENVAGQETLGNEIGAYLAANYKGDTKLVYGISIYSFGQKSDQIIRNTLNIVKKTLTDEAIKSRFINKGANNLESPAIKAEKLLQKGAEIIAIKGTKHIYLGKTLAIQDFESYSKRDFERPERDPRLGMLPPKLAQIMINLGGKTTLTPSKDGAGLTVYDPFCGIGTVIMEGLFLGYNGIGSDIDPLVIEKSQKNIEWVRKLVPYSNKFSTRFFVKDATALTASDIPENPDLIVTESYLGPPVSRMPTEENIAKNFNHIRELEIKFLRALHPILKKGTPLIISFPFYRDKHRFVFIDRLIEKISELGFKAEQLIPSELVEKFSLSGIHKRESLLYDRPDQIVGREIWKFVR